MDPDEFLINDPDPTEADIFIWIHVHVIAKNPDQQCWSFLIFTLFLLAKKCGKKSNNKNFCRKKNNGETLGI